MGAQDIVPFPGQGVAPPSRGDFGGIGQGTVVVTTPDGTEVTVSEDGSVVINMAQKQLPTLNAEDFSANLAERLGEDVLGHIADEIIDGVTTDIASRADLIDQYEKGIDLLGTRIEDISTPSAAGRSVSKIGHPLLMETMIKYHAGAEAELLPAEGPAKVATIGDVSTEEEQLAADFQTDFNYYLTDIASEYYPDTSRMIMHQGYCGNGYKKLYRCPMRDRPVSESVSMLDLIVSEEATDLQNATRVTHQIQMTRTQLRRMQIAGRYRDIDLGWSQALPREGHAVVKHSEGLSSTGMRPQDLPYILWEVDIDLDAEFYGIMGKYENKAPSGLPLPYKVTVEQNTRQVLAIWRNWTDGDKFYRKHNMYVQYGLVPTVGQFNYWGYLQILGNHTRALRAIWRLLIDSGMFANFPGGVKIKGARTSTNEIAPGPGEWVDIEAPWGTDITKVLMPLPYKTVDAVFMQLAEMIEAGAQRVGGAVMLETGEGRTNVPVGTIMAQIEIATQVMASIHRRNHRAQREELLKLRELFIESPEDLTKLARDPRRTLWVAEEFADLNLVPASDPDIPGQVGRIMQAWALMMVAGQNPMLYDMHEVNERVLRTIRVSDPDNVLKTPEQLAADAANMPPPGPPPKPPDPTRIAAVNLKGQQQQQQGQQKQIEMQQNAAEKRQEAQDKAHQVALESADRAADRASREKVAMAREETARIKLQGEERQRQQQAWTDQQQQHFDNLNTHYNNQVGAQERAKTAFDFPA